MKMAMHALQHHPWVAVSELLCVSVLKFGRRGSHDPYVLEYDTCFLTLYLFHMALAQAHGIFSCMI